MLFFQLFPDILRPKQQFRNFPDRAVATPSLGHIIHCRFNPSPCVLNRYGQAGFAENRQVGNIIPNIGDLVIGESDFLLEAMISGGFVVDALVDNLDGEFSSAMAQDIRGAASDKSDVDARALQQSNPLTVAHVEAFDLVTSIIDENTSVGKNSINVEEEQFNLLGLVLEFGRDPFHGALRRYRP